MATVRAPSAEIALPRLLTLFLTAYHSLPKDMVALFVSALYHTISRYSPATVPRITASFKPLKAFMEHATQVGGVKEAIASSPYMLFVGFYRRLNNDQRAALAELLLELVVELKKPQPTEDALAPPVPIT